jgi:hypothetical protein
VVEVVHNGLGVTRNYKQDERVEGWGSRGEKKVKILYLFGMIFGLGCNVK